LPFLESHRPVDPVATDIGRPGIDGGDRETDDLDRDVARLFTAFLQGGQQLGPAAFSCVILLFWASPVISRASARLSFLMPQPTTFRRGRDGPLLCPASRQNTVLMWRCRTGQSAELPCCWRLTAADHDIAGLRPLKQGFGSRWFASRSAERHSISGVLDSNQAVESSADLHGLCGPNWPGYSRLGADHPTRGRCRSQHGRPPRGPVRKRRRQAR